MSKFIHADDIHLDSPLRGLSRYESATADYICDARRKIAENKHSFFDVSAKLLENVDQIFYVGAHQAAFKPLGII